MAPKRDQPSPAASFDEAVYAWVRQVPPGHVVTYGQVATCLGTPRAARAVGFALARSLADSLPWHRVVNARGEISVGGHPHRPEMQRVRLEAEGLLFDSAGRLDLRGVQWDGRGARPLFWSPPMGA